MRHSPTCTTNKHGQCTCGSYYIETVEHRLDQALVALTEIARLGVNPTTDHGCVTRADFMRQGEKMWHVAFECISALNQQEKDEKKCPTAQV